MMKKTREQLVADTAKRQGFLFVAGTLLLAIAFGAAGLEVSVRMGLAGFFGAPGLVWIFFAARRPPEMPPAPVRKAPDG